MKVFYLFLISLTALLGSCKKNTVTEPGNPETLVRNQLIVAGALNNNGFYWSAPCTDYIWQSNLIDDDLTSTGKKRKIFKIGRINEEMKIYTPAFSSDNELKSNILSRGYKSIGAVSDFYIELKINGKTYTSLGDQSTSKFEVMEMIPAKSYEGKYGILSWIWLECNMYEKDGTSVLKWTNGLGGRSKSPNLVLFFND